MSKATVINTTRKITVTPTGAPGRPGILWDDDGWQADAYYVLHAGLYHNGSSYRAIAAHTSASATEPGTGADWEDAWEKVADKGGKGDQGPAVYSRAISQVVIGDDVNQGGWYLPSWLREDLNITHVHASVLTGSGSFDLKIKSDTDTVVYGPVTVESGTPLNADVDLNFLHGGAVIVDISSVDDVHAYEVQLDGVYS